MNLFNFIKKYCKKGVCLTLVAFLLMQLFVGSALAATISLRSSAANIAPGKTFSLKVYVDTQGKAINNAEAVITFPTDLVEITSVSPAGSIFSLWVEAPSFSNGNGTISFNGGVPNPGYTGSGGLAMSAVFKAKAGGTATFNFSSAAIRENDGLGTDILTGQGSARIEITPTEPTTEVKKEPETTPVVEVGKAAPTITSATHPNENAWSNVRNAVFSWKLPAGVTAVQTAIDASPTAAPHVNYRPAIYQKEVKDLTNGVWYFHLRYQNASGWSNASNYRVQIDLDAPKNLSVTEIESGKLSLKAEDDLSKIDYYNLVIDGQAPIKVTADSAKGPVALPLLSLGSHQLVVVVYDGAGNKSEITTEIKVTPKIAPTLVDFNKKIKAGETLKVSGEAAYRQVKVIIVVKDKTGQEIVKDVLADDSGHFNFTSDQLFVEGDYKLWAYLSDAAGNVGPLSEEANFTVSGSADIFKILLSIVPFKSYTDWLWLIIGLLIIAIAYSLYKIFSLKKKLNFVGKISEHSLELLLSKAGKQLAILEKNRKKPGLGAEEIKALKNLKEIISQIEYIKSQKK